MDGKRGKLTVIKLFYSSSGNNGRAEQNTMSKKIKQLQREGQSSIV